MSNYTIPRGGTDYKNRDNQPTGGHMEVRIHELFNPDYLTSYYESTADADELDKTEVDLTTALATLLALSACKNGHVVENLRTEELIYIDDSAPSTGKGDTCQRGVDGTPKDEIHAGDPFKYVGYAVVAASTTASATTIVTTSGMGTGYEWDTDVRNFGIILRRANNKPGEVIFCSASTVATPDLTVERNFGATEKTEWDFAIAAGELLFIIGEYADNPRDLTGTYGLEGWRKIGVDGDITIDNQGTKIILRINDVGAMRVLDNFEEPMVSFSVTNPKTYAMMSYSKVQLDARNDRKVAVDHNRYDEVRKFMIYLRSLDSRNERGHMYIVQSSSALSDGSTEEQKTFDVELMAVPDETMAGLKGVHYLDRVG